MGDEDMAEVAAKWGGASIDDGYWLCCRDTPLQRPAEAEEIGAW